MTISIMFIENKTLSINQSIGPIILTFMKFSGKMATIMVAAPTFEVGAPILEILDPPLTVGHVFGRLWPG